MLNHYTYIRDFVKNYPLVPSKLCFELSVATHHYRSRAFTPHLSSTKVDLYLELKGLDEIGLQPQEYLNKLIVEYIPEWQSDDKVTKFSYLDFNPDTGFIIKEAWLVYVDGHTLVHKERDILEANLAEWKELRLVDLYSVSMEELVEVYRSCPIDRKLAEKACFCRDGIEEYINTLPNPFVEYVSFKIVANYLESEYNASPQMIRSLADAYLNSLKGKL